MRTTKLASRRILILALILFFAVIVFLGKLYAHFNPSFDATTTHSHAQVTIGSRKGLDKPYVPLQEILPAPNVSAQNDVIAGLHVENVYGLSLKDRTFLAEGVYWLKWSDAINAIIGASNLSLDQLVHFANLVESGSMLVEINQPMPERLTTGEYWQLFHFSGKFYIPDLELKAFPFDVIHLPLTLELAPDDLSCYPGNPNGCIGLRADEEGMHNVLGQYVGINGYDVMGSRITEFLHQYPSNFGHGNLSAFSALHLDMVYRTVPAVAFWTYLFPLLVLVAIAIISPVLPGALGDVRLAIPTTIILTLIFLQIGYKAELPPLAYVSYLDWLYIYAYVVTAVLFLLFCWGTNAYTVASDKGEEDKAVVRINRVDTIVQVLASFGLLLVVGLGIFFHP
jgi:hypothetical protein